MAIAVENESIINETYALTQGPWSRGHRPNAPLGVGLIMSLYSIRVAGRSKNITAVDKFSYATSLYSVASYSSTA